MGRKKIDPKYQRKSYGFSLREAEKEDLKDISKNLGMTESETLRYLIMEAKKNQTWRNVIRNLYEVDRKNKALEAWDKTHPAECTEYKTVCQSFTSYHAAYHTVDQQEDYTTVHEEVSNEEIEELLDDYYQGLEEERNKECVHVTDR